MLLWLDKQFDWLKSFLSEKDGKGSNKRLISVVVITVFAISYLKIAIPSEELIDIPMNWAIVIGYLIGLNIWANKVENNGVKNG